VSATTTPRAQRSSEQALLHALRENGRLLTELGARYGVARLTPPRATCVIRSPADVAAYLGPEMADLAQEQLRVLLLNTKNVVVGACLVYQGGVNATVVRLADCFREAVRANAPAVILVHNHPSSDPTPSPEDVRLTRDAETAGDLLGIEVLDHVVLGRAGHVSLRERGLHTPARARRGTAAR
jgi:DNA repair protein RadC